MHPLSKVWHNSWAKGWGYAKLVAGSLGAGVSLLGQLLTNSEVKVAIDALHLDPKIMLGLAVMGAITIISAPHE